MKILRWFSVLDSKITTLFPLIYLFALMLLPFGLTSFLVTQSADTQVLMCLGIYLSGIVAGVASARLYVSPMKTETISHSQTLSPSFIDMLDALEHSSGVRQHKAAASKVIPLPVSRLLENGRLRYPTKT